ncbi:helix-turn-helix domain-containing protein [Halodesulfurarchaeum sp. HSR-GB]|nr:helix-turn-helix domain-containing protein [Halodesulfurarchaeum sp. HSR-GB]MDR5656389.1 helix-turn-helix domain-containing protein [Halodesulfurarchaeum sp. HSR-GB]
MEVESMVPLGESIIPYIWIYEPHRDGFEAAVKNHPSVESFEVQEVHDDRTLYALEWRASRDLVIKGIREGGAQLLEATGTGHNWRFELRFPSHDALSDFQDYCLSADIEMEVIRIYNPTKPDTGPWYGLSVPQREALMLAFREGYFDIPRQISTKELGNRLGISDQAVTERLRRGTSTLLAHSVMIEELQQAAESDE